MLLNPESLADSSQFEKLAPSIQSNDSKELVKAMDGEYNSNISLKSNNSSLLQPKMNTQIIKVNIYKYNDFIVFDKLFNEKIKVQKN